MLFITRIIQTITIAGRTALGPFTSLYMQARIYMRPGQAIKNQFASVTQRLDGFRSRAGSIGNSIVPQSWRKKLGLGEKSKRGGAGGGTADGEFGELDARKSRRLSGGRKLNALQKRAQFSQIHLINHKTGAREIAHIGQKVDRSWTETILSIDEKETVRLSYTIVDPTVYGSNVAVTYERGKPEIFVDHVKLTSDISLPLKDESLIQIGDMSYTVDMFAYESLPIQTRVDASWVTNVGPVRDDNQDAIGLYQHADGYMFTIADGVGGGYAGDIVSEYAIKYLLKSFQKNIKLNLSWVDILLKAYRHTNAEVRKFVERSPYPAGTTLTTVVIREWTAYIAHVGDSRVYHLRGTYFSQLTDDHREQYKVERTKQYEHIPDEFLPLRDVLVRAIGKRDDINPQMLAVAVQPGDKLLMITDGVTHQVSDAELYNILITEDIDEAPITMVQLANDRKNTDNASAILINVMAEAYEQDIWRAVSSERVYVGGKNWRLNLQRPKEMSTDYVLPNQVGCVWSIILLAVCALLWWLPQQMTINEVTPSTQAVIESVQTDVAAEANTVVPTSDDIVQPTSTIRSETVASDVPVISSTETPITTGNTAIPTEIPATLTPTIVPTNTIIPSPTATIPTRTPFPTIPSTLAPTNTPIPPTSTLRA